LCKLTRGPNRESCELLPHGDNIKDQEAWLAFKAPKFHE
jgi:hypothetical protein